MIKSKDYSFTKFISMILVSLLFFGNFSIHSQNSNEKKFSQALTKYSQGLYEEATSFLEEIQDLIDKNETLFNARVYLLLSACYEKMGKNNLARAFFKKVQIMLEENLIKQFPEIEGVDHESLQVYKMMLSEKDDEMEIIVEDVEEKEESHFEFKEPDPVSPIDDKEVIYSERRKEKRKKFPWMPIIVGVVILGVIVYFLFIKKKGGETGDLEVPEIEWVYIPAGEFQMGDNFNEGDSDEQPVHSVYLDGFYISKYEITVFQYDRFCRDTGRITLSVEMNIHAVLQTRPAHYVSWVDAKDFCDWMSQKTAENIHLPTEAQWEKAARGTNQYRYPWGNDAPDCNKANYNNCYYLLDVGQLSEGQTPTGIYDMAGNVWEWCQDWYSATYYMQSPYQNPQGPSTGSYRVIRGGSFISPANEIRSANRDFKSPGEESVTVGFRIVKEN